MRNLRLALCVALIVAALPMARGLASLGVVEGDPGWDCQAMGNGECGPGDSPVEGQPGWDCQTMGNGDCGAESSSLSLTETASVLAPPYAGDGHSSSVSCEGLLVDLGCAAGSQADASNGSLSADAKVAGISDHCGPNTPRCSQTANASATVFSDHEIPTPVRQVTYTAVARLQAFDVRAANVLTERSTAVVALSLRVDPPELPGLAFCSALQPAFRRTASNFQGSNGSNSNVTLTTTLTCKDRPGTLGVPVDVPAGVVRVHITAAAAATSVVTRYLRYVGTTEASIDIASSTLEASPSA